MARIAPAPSIPPGASVLRPPTDIPGEELKALSDVIQAALKQRQKVRASAYTARTTGILHCLRGSRGGGMPQRLS